MGFKLRCFKYERSTQRRIIIIIIIIMLNLLSPISYQVAVFCKSRSQQEIKAISPSTLWMLCAVLISVTFCSSVADQWPGSNRRFWSNPFLIVPNAPIVTGTVFVLTFHIQLTAMSSSFFVLA